MPTLPLLLLLVACTPDPVDTGEPPGDSAPEDTGMPRGGLLGRMFLGELVQDYAEGDERPWLDLWGPRAPGVADPRWGTEWEYRTELLLEEGGCQLLDTRPYHECDPACDFGFRCTAEGACVPEPENRSAGTLTLELPGGAISLERTGEYYDLVGDLPDDLHGPGAAVTFSAPGDEVPGFEVAVAGPVPLADPLDCDAAPEAGSAYTLTWTPAAEAGHRVRLELFAACHGGNGPMITCDAGDDGTLTVPQAVVEAYQRYRTPSEAWHLVRYREADAPAGEAGTMRLTLASLRACY